MNEIFNILIGRYIVRFVGKYCRYYFYKVVGKVKPIESLSNKYKNDDEFVNALSQDFKNTIVGIIVLGLIAVLLLLIAI